MINPTYLLRFKIHFCFATECNENLDLKISSIKKVELDNKFEISNIISYKYF